jgi:hypothetical protein
MYRLVRFLIITLTLGRIKWLMRLTWLWRAIVFLGLTGWLSKKLRQTVGLDKKASTDIDSAWADALRYTPQAATASGAAGLASTPPSAAAGARTQPSEAVQAAAPADEVSESLSEVTGLAADGSTETITIHEVDAGGETESIIRIEDEAGGVETLVTGTPVEEIDLANLGESATSDDVAANEPVLDVIEIEEIVAIEPDIESQAEVEVADLIETLESAEPESEAAPEPPRRKRAAKAKADAEPVAEAGDATAQAPAPNPVVDPDWVRGDGTIDCPESHPVKAKASSMIYYLPESGHYGLTIPDVCFASELDAESAGYRAPRR